MRETGLVRYESEDLEALRALILLKEQMTSAAFTSLLQEVDNEEASRVFNHIVDAARRDRSELEAVLLDWGRAAPRESDKPILADVTYRDIVNEWVALHESSAARLHHLASVAPSPELRSRLERLAAEDERHAEALRSLL